LGPVFEAGAKYCNLGPWFPKIGCTGRPGTPPQDETSVTLLSPLSCLSVEELCANATSSDLLYRFCHGYFSQPPMFLRQPITSIRRRRGLQCRNLHLCGVEARAWHERLLPPSAIQPACWMGTRLPSKGGVTWTSSFPWTLAGGSASMITYTTNHNWFAGSSYTQPTFDDGHADPGATGMVNTSNTGFITVNDLHFVNCGTPGFSNSDKCLVWEERARHRADNNTFATESWIGNYFIFDSPGSRSNLHLRATTSRTTPSHVVRFGAGQHLGTQDYVHP